MANRARDKTRIEHHSRARWGNQFLDALPPYATGSAFGNPSGLIRSGQSFPFGDYPLYRLADFIQGSSVMDYFDDDVTGNRIAGTEGFRQSKQLP